MEARLLSVNIGAPGAQPGVKALTGIDKRPVSGLVLVDSLGLLGDAVLDRKHHGGPDQAVYIYFQSDYDWWADVLGQPARPGRFGENLTIAGIPGDAVAIGDRLAIGEVELEITLHRTPCATFARHMGDPGWARTFLRAGRPGAYARVLCPGALEAGMPVRRRPFSGERVTVAETLALEGRRDIPAPTLRRVLSTPVHNKLRADFAARLSS